MGGMGIGLLVASFLSLLTLLEGRRGSRALTTTNNNRRHAGSKGEQSKTMYDKV